MIGVGHPCLQRQVSHLWIASVVSSSYCWWPSLMSLDSSRRDFFNGTSDAVIEASVCLYSLFFIIIFLSLFFFIVICAFHNFFEILHFLIAINLNVCFLIMTCTNCFILLNFFPLFVFLLFLFLLLSFLFSIFLFLISPPSHHRMCAL